MYDMGEFKGRRVIAASESEYNDSCKQDYDKFYKVGGFLYFFGHPIAVVTRDGRVRDFNGRRYSNLENEVAQYKMAKSYRDMSGGSEGLAFKDCSADSQPQRSESPAYEPVETGDRRVDEFMSNWRSWIDQRLEILKEFENKAQ